MSHPAPSQSRDNDVPLGTLVVNVLACALLGTVAGLGIGLSSPVGALLGTGFAATLSTYSTLGWETVALVDDGRWRAAVGYVAVSVVAGLAAVLLVRG